MLVIAVVAACINSSLKRNENKIDQEFELRPARREKVGDGQTPQEYALEKARQVVIEIENQCTDPYAADEENSAKNSSRSIKLTQANNEELSTARHLNEKGFPSIDSKPSEWKLNFDGEIQNESGSRIADLNEHHFFSAKELTNMSDYDQTKPSNNDNHVMTGTFSDHLQQVPRCESQQIRVHDNLVTLNPLYSSR